MIETKATASRFQQVIELVETMPEDDQALLIEIVRKRLVQRQRAALTTQVAEARETYQAGRVSRGSTSDLLAELDIP
jgi:hypothetical protein